MHTYSTQGKEAEQIGERALENVSEVFGDQVVAGGTVPSCQLPAYRHI